MNVLEKIKDLREARNWTIWKLSEESGVDQSTISAWYKKGRMPSIESLSKICVAFGITMSQFFSDETKLVDLTDSQFKMLEKWAELSEKQKEVIFMLMKSMNS